MRSREEFVQLHQHHFMGLLLDAVTSRRSGGELALWLDQAAGSIKDRLGKAWDAEQTKEAPKPAAPATNGAALPQRRPT